jgi:hypothetical protein
VRLNPRPRAGAIGPWLAIATLTAAGAAAAAGYGLTAPKRYQATAQLLVTPVPASDSTYTGLDLLRTGGKRTAAASAAALLRSPQVADAVRAQLGLTRSRDSLLRAVDPHVVEESDVVGITVEDTSAAGAAQLANAFADALVQQRTASFQSQLQTTIRRDEELLRTAKGAGAAELQRRLAVLRSLQSQPDPTLRSAGQASAPESAVWPNLPRLVGIGTGTGLAAGLVVALLLTLARIGRNARTPGTPEYDRRMPERVVEELEARLEQKVEALVTERERLAGREAALATREREVLARLEELRAAAPAAASPDEGNAREDDLARREQELAARVAALAQRELELARRAASLAAARKQEDDGELARREDELAARERELEAAAGAAAEAGAEQAAALARREEELAARIEALTQRELELARRAAGLAAAQKEVEPTDTGREAELDARVAALTKRELELARRAAALAVRERELAAAPEPQAEAQPEPPRPERQPQPGPRAPVAAPVAAPEPAPVPAAAGENGRGRWNLISLERLVEERGREFPDRVDEWTSYLYFLREYAEPDGTVPASFDWLIHDTFSELVA